jgi:hypothetical protein
LNHKIIRSGISLDSNKLKQTLGTVAIDLQDIGKAVEMRLPVERQVIGILGDQHLGDQRFVGIPPSTILADAGACTTALSQDTPMMAFDSRFIQRAETSVEAQSLNLEIITRFEAAS